MATITEEQIDTLKYICRQEDWKVTSYSGRAMFGEECLAIVMETEGLLRLGVGLQDQDKELANLLTNRPYRVDNMGRDSEVIYWESIKTKGTSLYSEDEEEDDYEYDSTAMYR